MKSYRRALELAEKSAIINPNSRREHFSFMQMRFGDIYRFKAETENNQTAEIDWQNALDAYRQVSNALEPQNARYQKTQTYLDEKMRDARRI